MGSSACLFRPALRNQHTRQQQLSNRATAGAVNGPEREDPFCLSFGFTQVTDDLQAAGGLVRQGTFIEAADPRRCGFLSRLPESRFRPV